MCVLCQFYKNMCFFELFAQKSVELVLEFIALELV